jgi:CRP/FNR family transcriptional regulator
MRQPATTDVAREQACTACALAPFCQATRAAPLPGAAVERGRMLAPGEVLFREGQPQAALYALRAGCLAASVADGCGGAHIVRFLLPGDVAGLDAHGGARHRSSARSVGASEVCELRAWHVDVLCAMRPALGAHLDACVARELDDAQRHAAALARLDATQRVARFLLRMARRGGGGAGGIALPMGRRELGEHLGLTMETTSRLLTGFKARGWIGLPPHGVVIRDAAALERAACQPHDP